MTAPKELQSQIKSKNVEEIINGWNSELDENVQKFMKQAREIAQWDKLLIENGDKVCIVSVHGFIL